MTTGLDTGVRPAHILIVDDEPHNRILLEVMLAPEGFELSMAANGEQALDMVAHHAFDLILLDIMMPGMDGYQVAARIKANPATRDVLIVMLSALDDRNSRMHGLTAGAEYFLTKPVNRVELCDEVRRLLAARIAP